MKVRVPETLKFLFKPKRIKVLYGGRGGYKSVSIAKSLLFLGYREKKNILAAREFMNSIDDSVHSVFKEEVEALNMGSHYNLTDRRVKGVNGTQISYIGLARNLSSLKSRHGVDIFWLEEGETVPQRSLDVVFPTIRKEGSEIWISFNPDDEFGAVFSTFVKPHLDSLRKFGFYEDENLYVAKTSLAENPYASKKMLEESARMKKDSLKKWLHIYGGEVFSDYRKSIIQPEWIDTAIDAHKKLGFPAQGVKVSSFDPADTGKDAKAWGMRHGSVVTKGFQWSDGELQDAIEKAFSNSYDNRVEQFVYDSAGLGRGVKGPITTMAKGKQMEIIPHEGAGEVPYPDEIYEHDRTNKNTFKNARAYGLWILRDRFEKTFNAIKKGIYSDPDSLISLSSEMEDLDVLKSELVKIRRRIGPNSYIQIESKEDMIKRGVRSPNMADMLYMLWMNPAPFEEVPEINFLSEF